MDRNGINIFHLSYVDGLLDCAVPTSNAAFEKQKIDLPEGQLVGSLAKAGFVFDCAIGVAGNSKTNRAE